MIPVSVMVHTVMAWDVIVVIIVAHVAAGMVVEVRGVVPDTVPAPMPVPTPVAVTAPVTIAAPTASIMPMVSMVSMAAVRAPNVDMDAITPEMYALCFYFFSVSGEEQCNDGR